VRVTRRRIERASATDRAFLAMDLGEAIVDPDHFPDGDALAAALSEELRLISTLPDPDGAPSSGSQDVSQADPVRPSDGTRT